jgi:hypothetical protein
MALNSKFRSDFTIYLFFAISLIVSIIIVFVVDEYPGIWPKFVIPLFIMSGFLGRVFNFRLFVIIGWLGILLFLPIAFMMSLPNSEIANPKFISISGRYFRYALILISAIAWIWCFQRLKPARM